ncbi:hypothetical protein JX266_009227 [Neoarthrinium moseri]|nr:hypothetical protein JX266_009227 [Neoarthrinium moseri]
MPPLVTYTSDSDSDSDSDPAPDPEATAGSASGPASKKRKTSHQGVPTQSALPPLPAAFHDLYASTVRVSNVDDPSLHQGRKRQIPHVVGNWPSHLYVEWHPSSEEHAVLDSLLRTLGQQLEAKEGKYKDSGIGGTATDSDVAAVSAKHKLSTFLASDLGAPLPLHISLSRPLALTTAQKDDFLARLRASLGRSGVRPFELAPTGLEWHRTHESARSFLVLRVGSRRKQPSGAGPAEADDGDRGKSGAAGAREPQAKKNPELAALLGRCNALCASFGQPELYAFKPPASSASGGAGEEKGSSRSSGGPGTAVGDAFHVSIAWSFAEPTPEMRRVTEQVFARAGCGDAVADMRIKVDGVKAKIGNVVTHIGLLAPGSDTGNEEVVKGERRGLFGL